MLIFKIIDTNIPKGYRLPKCGQ